MKAHQKIIALLFVVATLGGCADVLVAAGLQEATPPTTNSTYYNERMTLLVQRLKQNRARSFRKGAVLDFVNTNGKVSELGRYLSLKFSEVAAGAADFKVVPDGQVREALTKLEISYDGKLTKEQVAAIGSEVGADTIITGALSDLQKGSDVDLSIKAIQTNNGDLNSAASVDIYRSKQVQALIQQF